MVMVRWRMAHSQYASVPNRCFLQPGRGILWSRELNCRKADPLLTWKYRITWGLYKHWFILQANKQFFWLKSWESSHKKCVAISVNKVDLRVTGSALYCFNGHHVALNDYVHVCFSSSGTVQVLFGWFIFRLLLVLVSRFCRMKGLDAVIHSYCLLNSKHFEHF